MNSQINYQFEISFKLNKISLNWVIINFFNQFFQILNKVFGLFHLLTCYIKKIKIISNFFLK